MLPSSDLEDLYQQVLLDHSRRPRNFGELSDADATNADEKIIKVQGDNPSCGDEIVVSVKLGDSGKLLADIKFTGQGCAISQASASLMTIKTKGKSRAEVEELMAAFHDLITKQTEDPPDFLGDLQLLQGVWRFPQRVKCATLAWRALEQALKEGTEAVVSTEE
ncbi:MAG: Fe-S cluster assembly sulfur transfer protein SufU [Verrucomicrobium sp.]|nr:SUF system NifU family Fe-S cluster assembly protein [Verrucomicrobium sp.]